MHRGLQIPSIQSGMKMNPAWNCLLVCVMMEKHERERETPRLTLHNIHHTLGHLSSPNLEVILLWGRKKIKETNEWIMQEMLKTADYAYIQHLT